MKKEHYKIHSILESLAANVHSGAITLEEAAVELYRAGWLTFSNDYSQARTLLKLNEHNGKPVFDTENFSFDTVSIGDYCTGAVVMDFMDMLPPVTMCARCSQIGEPYSHKYDETTGKYRATYSTFRLVEARGNGPYDNDSIWEYCGNCFAGETQERGKEPPYII